MSIYRTLDDGPVSEISIHHVEITRTRPRRPPGEPRPAVDYHRLRKANPASTPLSVTFRWIARLPDDVRPYALLRKYPRIANALALTWRNPIVFRGCLYDLLVDKRENRRGFPPDVLQDLLKLREYFEKSCL
jgi:hypothetical protein